MLNKLGKKNVSMLLILISIPILLIIFLVVIRSCSSSGSSYSDYEKKMVSAAEKYFKNMNNLPVGEGDQVSVSLEDLVSKGMIKSPIKALDDKSCTGYVSVRKNGSLDKNEKNGFYLYIPNLNCEKYNTVHLVDKLKDQIVFEKSGLYEIDDEYVFKGNKVNNYVKFFDTMYRVISVDNNGIIKMVKVDKERNSYNWDNKYNSQRKMISGKNDYSDSNLIDKLSDLYKKMSDNNKKHIVAYSVCAGNRSEKYYNIDTINECSNRVDGQYLSVLNLYDFARASYDPECNSYNSPSCRNYNYLYKTIDSTWLLNGNSDNSYGVFYYSFGKIYLSDANNNLSINIVIYIDGNELYTSGDGSFEKPYIIK